MDGIFFVAAKNIREKVFCTPSIPLTFEEGFFVMNAKFLLEFFFAKLLSFLFDYAKLVPF